MGKRDENSIGTSSNPKAKDEGRPDQGAKRQAILPVNSGAAGTRMEPRYLGEWKRSQRKSPVKTV